MTFEDTYAEYKWLRVELGLYPEGGMIRKVWEGCEPDAQENMLEQLRKSARYANRYVATHGEAW